MPNEYGTAMNAKSLQLHFATSRSASVDPSSL